MEEDHISICGGVGARRERAGSCGCGRGRKSGRGGYNKLKNLRGDGLAQAGRILRGVEGWKDTREVTKFGRGRRRSVHALRTETHHDGFSVNLSINICKMTHL